MQMVPTYQRSPNVHIYHIMILSTFINHHIDFELRVTDLISIDLE